MIACPPRDADRYAAGQVPPAPANWDLAHASFGEVLSALNPLQYLPVVGMIYRLVTGHHTPAPLQIGVAAATTLLLGGPIGLAGTMLLATATEVVRAGASAGTAQAHPAHVARLYAHASQFG